MTDYRVFRALSEAQYGAIVDDGTLAGRVSPLRTHEAYAALIATTQPANVDPRLPLSFVWAEGHFGSDPGLAAAGVQNYGGIKWVGQDGATDSGIAADTGGTYAAFADVAAYWREWLRIMQNGIIGPDFAAGNLVGVVEHYTNGPGTGGEKITQYERYVARWPAEGAMPSRPPVTPAAIVAAALSHVGEARAWDAWNGAHPVEMMCEADVEDWYSEAGLSDVPHYASAAAAGDDGPLSAGRAPLGAQVFFRGAGWSAWDHTGISLGDGRTVSGLHVVTLSEGWQELPTYRGWRYAPGLALAAADGPFYAAGNPYGAVALKPPFWNRWHALAALGLALPMMGWPKGPERLAGGRRIQPFERGWYGTQAAPNPWDVVQLLPTEVPPA